MDVAAFYPGRFSYLCHNVLQAVPDFDNVVATTVSNISGNVTDGDVNVRPWYMSGGTQWPLPAAKSPKSGRRMALLWPEEDPGSDRITNQLMFVPPSPPAGDLSGHSLKKILYYYGQIPWFPVKPGTYMFREARCPVDTCTITLDQNQITDADAIIYNDRFEHPSHPRPPRQVGRLQLLYTLGSTENRDRLVSPALYFINWVFEIVTKLRYFFISYHPVQK